MKKDAKSTFLWKRVFAYLIDVVIITVVIVFPTDAISPVKEKWSEVTSFNELYDVMMATSHGISMVLMSILVAILTVLYWALLERYNNGQSVGKMAMGIKVESLTKRMTLKQGVIRNLAKLSSILLLIDTIYLMVKKENQRFSDKIAKTRVVAVQ